MKYSPLIGVGLLMLFTGMMMSAVAVANLNVIPNTVLNPLNIYPIVKENLEIPKELVSVGEEIDYENYIVYHELENVQNLWDENLETYATQQYSGLRTIIDIELPDDNYLVIVYCDVSKNDVYLRGGWVPLKLGSGLNSTIISGNRIYLDGYIWQPLYIYELAIYRVKILPIRVVDRDNKPVENACVGWLMYNVYTGSYSLYGCDLTNENGEVMYVAGVNRIVVHKENKKLYIGGCIANVRLDDYELKGKTYDIEVSTTTAGVKSLSLAGNMTKDTVMLKGKHHLIEAPITLWVGRDSWVMYSAPCSFMGGINKRFDIAGKIFNIETEMVNRSVKATGEITYSIENYKLVFICRGVLVTGRAYEFTIFGSAWLENNDIVMRADALSEGAIATIDIRVKNGKELIMAYFVPSLKLPLIFIGLGMIGVGLVGTTKIEFER